MKGYLMFVLGLIIGSLFGVFIMCCLQINRLDDEKISSKMNR